MIGDSDMNYDVQCALEKMYFILVNMIFKKLINFTLFTLMKIIMLDLII